MGQGEIKVIRFRIADIPGVRYLKGITYMGKVRFFLLCLTT
jgi:hypothetical protein